ncbi:acetyl-CoA carboxylase biotin carboxylase subunit [Engelhardtia mirabilis]|uniref:Biotin carboxylase n=1 Tax=Engelhardtia mirabilis TaxID=2528011 RepID=A0A518BKB2_9BACT|nr:Biotin carboxylase [Planctomycetes bacterium Pla133]QDV01737.1 Biotin carboxylase [Planctomycetes bacterium Pla86]
MFGRVLVANRGEIAQRIIRAARELGVETVAVYSEADADALYLKQADETICIGPAAGAKSYLNIPSIISAAEIADVDAIVPGYGFLAENAHFAEVCRSCNIQFVGPDPETISSLGNKSRAREMAMRAGVPVVPGSPGALKDEEEALKIAREIGYPVMIKASAGGGGRGMRLARNDASLTSGFHAARAEAEAAFGDGTMYLEKFVENPRHVEIQILGDQHGNLVYLGERDCSVQRRHQKVVEESPSPSVSPALRREMGEAALRIAREAGYYNAGTVEFLMDRDKNYYFIEVNARIQVEHTVTEMVTGVDLIQEQLRMASGEHLSFTQDDVELRGHCIEVRINAEDPDRNFQPSPGRIEQFVAPGGPGIRLDSHVYAGYTIPPNYDSMIGKLLAHRADRTRAIRTMLRALDEFVIVGPKTTIGLARKILGHSEFLSGEHDTGFVERFFSSNSAAVSSKGS